MRRLTRSWILAGAVLILSAGAGQAAASASTAGTATESPSARPVVKVCGQGPALVRPESMVLTCADDGELAEHLHWSSWTGTRATAAGIVAWRACSSDCADSLHWDYASADVTLADPRPEPANAVLFTRLELHVTGSTPRGFLRNLAFDETPTPTAPAPPANRHVTRQSSSAAPRGTLDYAQIEGFWADAGGPTATQGSYTDDEIAAAITGAESSFLPGIIQPGVDYCGSGANRAGWGLWQITCGNSVPADGTDFQLLDPWNNAEAAVSKYDADVRAGLNGFDPWSTYTDGAYGRYLQHISADTRLTNPGQYVQINSTPPGTPSSPGPDPGSTYGPPMPGVATAFTFWKGQNGDLFEAQGQASGRLLGPTDRHMGPLGSAPAVGVDGNGHTYVYWEGNGPQYDLWEAYWNGSAWVGPFDRGMGPLGSAPTVAVTSGGTAYVFWKGQDGDLREAQGPADGNLAGPTDLRMGPLGSAPTTGINSRGDTYVYWQGTAPQDDLWEAYWSGSKWVGPYNREMGPLGSAPSVAVTGGGTAYVFWKGQGGDLFEAQGPADGNLAGPTDRHMGPLGSAPAAGVGSNGATYVYWEGNAPRDALWEGFWNGSAWTGPDDRGLGPLGSAPTVAMTG